MAPGLVKLLAVPTRSTAAMPRLPMPMPLTASRIVAMIKEDAAAAAADADDESDFDDVQADAARGRRLGP